MKMNPRWTRVPALASLVVMGVFLMGADKGGCGPIDPTPVTEDQCTAAADCEGLPHVMCLGAWACESAACKWQCTTAPVECTDNSQCAKGETCQMVAECPECTREDPPCAAPCRLVGHCAPPVVTEKCVVGGCSGELCLPESQGGVASICLYLDWYKCLQFTTCGNFGENGACAWEKTAEFEKCMGGQACGSDAPCGAGYVCVDGVCVKPEEPVGCHSNEDCKPGTHCSVSDGDCGVDPNCPMCDVCYGTCVPDVVPVDCTADADCPEGFFCAMTPDCPPCVYEDPACKMACQMTGKCEPKPVTTCIQDSDCAEGQYCRIDACPVDANCAAPDGTTDPAPNCLCTGTCQPREEPGKCQTDADCPKGERCYWTGACPPCDCASGESDCACDACLPVESGFCGPYCDPTQAEICNNGLDDNCNGIVDEDCANPVYCMSNADCATWEYCDYEGPVYDEAGALSCCPPNAKCTSEIPPCGMGQCRLQPGTCWTDADCGPDSTCQGAIRCPPGAMCFVADQPGTCTPVERLPCQGDADCPEGQVCQWTGCPPCDCAPDDPACSCPMCMPAMNGWCVPSTCVDMDGDGWCGWNDCDDMNAAVFPGGLEVCDGLDNNCDGIVDEGCRPQCFGDADCASYEYCQIFYAGTSGAMACCPPNAFCDATIPPCGGGTCVLQPGLCWTDGDCGYAQKCEGAIVCPEGALCIIADRPGKCVDAGAKCTADADCGKGEFCDMSRTPIDTCCMPGEICLMIYLPCEGVCMPQSGACSADTDCATGQACRQVTVCPACTMAFPPCEMPCTVEGQCMNQCLTNADCLPNQYCEIVKCGASGEKCLGPYYCLPYGLD